MGTEEQNQFLCGLVFWPELNAPGAPAPPQCIGFSPQLFSFGYLLSHGNTARETDNEIVPKVFRSSDRSICC
jgi:hypothetical protein